MATCHARTKKGFRCKNNVYIGDKYCSIHKKHGSNFERVNDIISVGQVRKAQKPGKSRYVEVRGNQVSLMTGTNIKNPSHEIAKEISNALDPTKAHGKVKTLENMSSSERAKMESLYGSISKDSNWSGIVEVEHANKWNLVIKCGKLTARVSKSKLLEGTEVSEEGDVGLIVTNRDPFRQFRNFLSRERR